jgi:hypothetical protein
VDLKFITSNASDIKRKRHRNVKAGISDRLDYELCGVPLIPKSPEAQQVLLVNFAIMTRDRHCVGSLPPNNRCATIRN